MAGSVGGELRLIGPGAANRSNRSFRCAEDACTPLPDLADYVIDWDNTLPLERGQQLSIAISPASLCCGSLFADAACASPLIPADTGDDPYIPYVHPLFYQPEANKNSDGGLPEGDGK